MKNRDSWFFSEKFRKYLEGKQEYLLKRWKDIFWESFGEEAKRFFVRETDRFQNPVGYRVEECFKGIMEVLFGEFSWEKAQEPLKRLMQIRAVQEPVPSKALNLFLQLKTILREEIGREIIDKFGIEEFLQLEDRINILTLRAFDYFIKFRETLYEIKFNEYRRNTFLLLKRAGLVYDPMEGMVKSIPEEENY
ncbi:MAG: RsbRD N-terminal domain-containing protein [Thermodesulfobacteriaceae bacterium]|nr:RsbRD N-terminal domain-containing protein [Thermodesulfobacteriaceae bacterium]MCX8041204.1 RsbRD N-terminal domain-containing protein [Thermodesulfobacteriaceae bacterium]MDW8135158.1 RsbRD N-terminal domain-containing protein [Thermodesulfobacterium sp.]